MTKFEVTVKVTLYGASQAVATTVIEDRLKAGHKPQDDPNGLVIEETNIKRAKDQR